MIPIHKFVTMIEGTSDAAGVSEEINVLLIHIYFSYVLDVKGANGMLYWGKRRARTWAF